MLGHSTKQMLDVTGNETNSSTSTHLLSNEYVLLKFAKHVIASRHLYVDSLS